MSRANYFKSEGILTLGMDADCRFTNSGTPVTNLVAYNNEYWTDSNGNDCHRAERIALTLWGEWGHKLANRLNKGTLVHVRDLRMKTDTYIDTNGVKRYTTKFTCQPGCLQVMSAPKKQQAGDFAEPDAEKLQLEVNAAIDDLMQ